METAVSSTQMLVGLGIGIVLLLFLAMKTRVHIFVALIISSITTGLIGGLAFKDVISSITGGFGSTLGSTGIIIGLGVMMGAVLEKSGAAEQMAFSIIKLVGKGREEWALAITGYIVAIPVFADSGLVILTPLAKSLSRMTGKSVVGLGLALATGLQLTHVFVPPTPGPLAVAGILDIDLGLMILAGVGMTLPTLIMSTLYSIWLGKRLYIVPNEDGTDYIRGDFKEEYIRSIENVENVYKEKNLPGAALSFSPIVVPLILILLKTVTEFVKYSGAGKELISTVGHPIMALIIGLLLAIYGLGKRYSKDELFAAIEDGVKSTGMIMLITGAGGALGYVVRDAGIGDALGEAVLHSGIPGILVPFVIAALMRISLGSATVALITAATLTAPLVTQMGLNPVLVAMSTCAGAVSFSYFNDSGFWVFNGLYGLKEVKDQFMAKTMVSFIGAGSCLALVLVLSLFF
ncbi:GntP family permease [Tuanshanicoccus lijuaniae]|uniref:GntP family permease n=1 Tax=Aerococcaceae bacterium zg-1292 TaxID=2774330 RepID=UPI001936F845|nr:GntP family permease [Aerococcaceae bacterium zg-1292]MBF6626425.1 GntP family permease [Aerococcaceae bacterium zg-BR9]MBS4455702.1 gluconate:H+ symporter [Aerococcaceae bacterium zg-A91]MBS4457453.1 gluconate:H+ symporter [Aerococcaceae bacterium zg-BR33]QQA37101.1 GntP family permease [Aerococcaceae bacterium zg-1292]